jgi:hypothetical protein
MATDIGFLTPGMDGIRDWTQGITKKWRSPRFFFFFCRCTHFSIIDSVAIALLDNTHRSFSNTHVH